MRRIALISLIATISVLLALPAHAGKLDVCDKNPNHPSCTGGTSDPDDTTEPLPSGTTCGTAIAETGTFEIMLGGRHTRYATPPGLCIDVMSHPGEWTIDVEVLAGTLRELDLYLRDSFAPGDGCFDGGSCGLALRDIPSTPGVVTTIDLGEMPGAHINACGLQYGEVVDVDDGWVVYDTVEESIPSPLAFMPSMRASNDAVVKLTVHTPDG